MESNKTIKNWAADDRPREKLIAHGAATLSNSELLGILIQNGTINKSAVDLAKEIMKLGNDNLQALGKLSIKDFQKVKGIGQAKAITITAALELGRRRAATEGIDAFKVSSSKDIAQYLKEKYQDLDYEQFGCVYLNIANKIIAIEIISKGGLSSTIVDTRIILKAALDHKATGFILFHNHPSGNLQPSKEDIHVTQKIKAASDLLDIKLLDHIIISNAGYFSFADENLLYS
ncbi:MAG: JAB domain-containing protein [Chitinophagaceae bacterium]|nr:MAG: JAB domain-containing protein [Chitinophagaceae bacterium]